MLTRFAQRTSDIFRSRASQSSKTTTQIDIVRPETPVNNNLCQGFVVGTFSSKKKKQRASVCRCGLRGNLLERQQSKTTQRQKPDGRFDARVFGKYNDPVGEERDQAPEIEGFWKRIYK